MMQKNRLKRIRHSALAGFSALSLLVGSFSAPAEDIVTGDDTDFSDSGSSGGSIDAGDSGSSDSAFLIEDTGEDVSYNAGVSMDTLQDAIDSGDKETLKKIASLGALTGSTSSSSSGVGGGGAYRGANKGEDVDPDEYYDLQLDEGDADEVETTAVNESPGPLMAANADLVQQHLDSMTQVESPTGSDGELTVAAYIETKLGEMGYTVQEQAFHEGVLNEDGVDAPGVNILAERGANSQTNRKSDIFLVVTHYDSKRSPEEDDPFANDKSGAAALIESARILSEVVTDTDICFLFLSGEEDGGYGAESFIASLSDENRARITGVLSVERVGYDSDTPYVLKTMTGESNALGDIVQQLGIANDAHLSLAEEDGIPDSDEDDGTWVEVGQSSDGYIDEATAAQIAAEQAGTAGPDEHAIDIDTNDYIEEEAAGEEAADEEDAVSLDEEDPAAASVPMPSAWSYLKADSPSMTHFADASFTTVTVSQYIPDLDAQNYEETKALGLADTTVEAINEAMQQNSGDPASTDGSESSAVTVEDSNLTASADEAAAPSEDGAAASPEGEAAASSEDTSSLQEEAALDYLPEVDANRVADTVNVIAACLAHIMDPAT